MEIPIDLNNKHSLFNSNIPNHLLDKWCSTPKRFNNLDDYFKFLSGQSLDSLQRKINQGLKWFDDTYLSKLSRDNRKAIGTSQKDLFGNGLIIYLKNINMLNSPMLILMWNGWLLMVHMKSLFIESVLTSRSNLYWAQFGFTITGEICISSINWWKNWLICRVNWEIYRNYLLTLNCISFLWWIMLCQRKGFGVCRIVG